MGSKNPFRVFEDLRKKSGTFEFSNIYETHYFYKIKNLFCIRFEWENLPKEIPPMFVEEVLFWRGMGVFIYDDILNSYAFMRGNLTGMPDIYDVPNIREAYTSNGYISNYGKDNSVICWDSPSRLPYCISARMYAHAMATTWRTKDLNMFAQRTPVTLVSTDEERLTFEVIGEQYENFTPIIKLKDSINLDKIKSINLNAPYIVDKCELELRDLKSQVLTDLGYESNPIEKRERLVVSETQGNNGETEAMRNSALVMRQRCADAMNKMWGLNINVKFRSILPSMVEEFIPNTFTTSKQIYKEGGGGNE